MVILAHSGPAVAGRLQRREESIGALPNGSRLSCGRNPRGRKVVERQTKRLGGEATPFFPTCERPGSSLSFVDTRC